MYRSTESYFTGHQFDGSLNIYYADAWFYDAETGTWLSPDPIKDGRNWYVYCENNPVTFVDFTGLFADNYFTNLTGSDFEGDYTLYVNGKKMTVSRQGNDLRTDKDKDQIALLKEAGVLKGLFSSLKYYLNKDSYSSLTVSQIAELAGAEDTFSTWKETEDEMITVFNPAMKDQGVRVTRYGADVSIDVDVHFSGDVEATLIPGGKTFSQLTVDGMKGWEGTFQAQEKNGIVYDSFGVYDAVNVTVNVTVKDSPDNALQIVLHDNSRERLNTTSCGQNIPNVSPNGESPERENGEDSDMPWYLDEQGVMTMYSNRRALVSGREASWISDIYEYGNEPYTEEMFVSVIRHEFGHVLGLEDAYKSGLKFDQEEILQEDWPMGDVMWKNGPVTSNDVEMVLEAWKLNIQQGFRLENLSSVIRLPAKPTMD